MRRLKHSTYEKNCTFDGPVTVKGITCGDQSLSAIWPGPQTGVGRLGVTIGLGRTMRT